MEQALQQSETQRILETIKEDAETRGRPIKCKICGKTFKILGEENKKNWYETNYVCPHCNEDYCILPDTERQLRRLQDEYYILKEEKTLVKMIMIMNSYCRSLILKYFHNKISYEGQLEYFIHNTLSITVEEILTKENFKIHSSFAGYLICNIKWVIFGKQEHLIEGDSLDYMFEDGHFVHYEDPSPQLIDIIEKEEETVSICKDYCSLIFDLELACNSKQENYVRLLNILLFLKDGERAVNNFFNHYDKENKYITLKTLEVLKQRLLDNAQINYGKY